MPVWGQVSGIPRHTSDLTPEDPSNAINEEGGSVNPNIMKCDLPRSNVLVIARCRGDIVAVGAVKPVRKEYAAGIAINAPRSGFHLSQHRDEIRQGNRHQRKSCRRLRAFSLRTTAVTNALSNEADIAKVQEWMGHANVSISRLYDRRKSKPEDSPTFHVKY
jgi:hypothetical protein